MAGACAKLLGRGAVTAVSRAGGDEPQHGELTIKRHQTEVHSRSPRPVCPLPLTLGWNGSPSTFPRASHPPLPAAHIEGDDRPVYRPMKETAVSLMQRNWASRSRSKSRSGSTREPPGPRRRSSGHENRPPRAPPDCDYGQARLSGQGSCWRPRASSPPRWRCRQAERASLSSPDAGW